MTGAMGAALFYHLTRRPADETLRMLLEKALEKGMRVAVRGTDRDRLARLDDRLWLGEGFLPHGLAGAGFDADQPVLLTEGSDMPNGAACLMAMDGADVAADEAGRLERVCILFDGNDPAAVERARRQWRSLTGAGVAAQYWSEETGRWHKKAESGN